MTWNPRVTYVQLSHQACWSQLGQHWHGSCHQQVHCSPCHHLARRSVVGFHHHHHHHHHHHNLEIYMYTNIYIYVHNINSFSQGVIQTQKTNITNKHPAIPAKPRKMNETFGLFHYESFQQAEVMGLPGGSWQPMTCDFLSAGNVWDTGHPNPTKPGRWQSQGKQTRRSQNSRTFHRFFVDKMGGLQIAWQTSSAIIYGNFVEFSWCFLFCECHWN